MEVLLVDMLDKVINDILLKKRLLEFPTADTLIRGFPLGEVGMMRLPMELLRCSSRGEGIIGVPCRCAHVQETGRNWMRAELPYEILLRRGLLEGGEGGVRGGGNERGVEDERKG